MEDGEFNKFIGTIKLGTQPSLDGVKLTKRQFSDCSNVIRSKHHLNWDNWMITKLMNTVVKEETK